MSGTNRSEAVERTEGFKGTSVSDLNQNMTLEHLGLALLSLKRLLHYLYFCAICQFLRRGSAVCVHATVLI